jgi:hypothetical protein
MSDWPKVINQASFPGAGNVDDCWVVATVWAALAFRADLPRPTVPEFRRHAGNPDDPNHADGGSRDQIVRGARGSWPGVRIKAFFGPWPDFRDQVQSGRPASLGVVSAKLPRPLQFGFAGNHQIGVGWDPDAATFVVANPLARDGSKPLPIDADDLRDAATALFGSNVGATIFPTRTGGDMAIFEISGPDTGPYPVTVKAGAKVLAQDGVTQIGTITDTSTPFMVVGESEDGKLVLLHGRAASPRTRLGFVQKASTRRG